jgi:hypothetical protein
MDFEPNTISALRCALEKEKERLGKFHSDLQHEANSSHPDSLDAINMQRKIKGKIEGIQWALECMNDMRL